jgi:hypothetical protein
MKKHLLYVLSCTLFLINYTNSAKAQCVGGTLLTSITPSSTWQTLSIQGGRYATFTAAVGTLYTFTYCSNGGVASFDTEITILDNLNNPLAYNDDFCGTGSELTWSPTTAGTYRVYITEYNCLSNLINSTLAYRSQPTCVGTSKNPTTTFSPTNNNLSQVITTCQQAGQYAEVTLVAFRDYEFYSSVSADFFTITTNTNVYVTSGTTPFVFEPQLSGTYRIHLHTNSNCGTSSTCRAFSMSCTSCPVVPGLCIASSQYPSSIIVATDTTTANPILIDSCNWGGEYATVSLAGGKNYQFTSSISTDFIVITDNNNNIADTGTGSVTVSTLTATLARMHIFANSNCQSNNNCRVTTVSCINCLIGNCIGTAQNPATVVAANSTNAPKTVSSCVQAGQYSAISLTAGNTYTFNSSINTDYITITDTANNILLQGTTPLTGVANVNVTVRVHIHSSSNCGTNTTCRSSIVTCDNCPPPIQNCISTTQFPTTAIISGTDNQAKPIAPCNYAGEYAEVFLHASQSYSFSSSVSTDFITITDLSNNVIHTGTSPISVSVTVATTVRVHFFLNAQCQTANVCRLTQVTCTTCPPPANTSGCIGTTKFPSATVTANNTYVPLVIDSCSHAGQYSEINLANGQTYQFATSINTDYLTITDMSNSVLVVGNNPLTVVANQAVTIRFHVHGNSSCNTNQTCRVTSVTCLSCAPPSPTGATTNVTNLCSGDSATLTLQGASGVVQWFTVSCGGTFVGNGNSINVSPTATTTYYARNFGNGQASANCVTVTVAVLSAPSAPLISANGSTSFCNGDSVQLSANLSSGITWSNNSTTQQITVTASGTFTAIFTDNNNCKSPASNAIQVTVFNTPPAPSVVALGNTTLCAGDSVELEASQASGIKWSNNATTSSIFVSAAGSYSATYTDNNSCESAVSNAISIFVNPLPSAPSISTTGALTFCDGDSVVLTASPTSGINWSSGQNTGSITVKTAGAFSATYTDNNNCTSFSSSSLTVSVNPLPAMPSINKVGETLECSENASSYQWFLDGSVIPNQTNKTITPAANGLYSVEITDNNGCKNISDTYNYTSVNLNEITQENDISIFPNPNSGSFYVKLPLSENKQYSIQLYSIDGKMVYNKNIDLLQSNDNLMEIKLDNVASGLYNLSIRTSTEVYFNKLIIK